MVEKGFKGGLVTTIKNSHSGKKYVISTAKLFGSKKWQTVMYPKYLGILPIFWKKIFDVYENNKENAHLVHNQMKEIATNLPEEKWFERIKNGLNGVSSSYFFKL